MLDMSFYLCSWIVLQVKLFKFLYSTDCLLDNDTLASYLQLMAKKKSKMHFQNNIKKKSIVIIKSSLPANLLFVLCIFSHQLFPAHPEISTASCSLRYGKYAVKVPRVILLLKVSNQLSRAHD